MAQQETREISIPTSPLIWGRKSPFEIRNSEIMYGNSNCYCWAADDTNGKLRNVNWSIRPAFVGEQVIEPRVTATEVPTGPFERKCSTSNQFAIIHLGLRVLVINNGPVDRRSLVTTFLMLCQCIGLCNASRN
jgi:hypothetical protein